MDYGWFPVRLDGPAQQNLSDRSNRIRGDIDLGPAAPWNGNRATTNYRSSEPTDQRSNGSSEMTKENQFLITPINPVTYTKNPQRPEIRLYPFLVSLHFHHGLLGEATP